MSISLKQGTATAVFVLGLSAFGVGGALAGHEPDHSGATPPAGALGPLVSDTASGGDGSVAIRTLITDTIDNPNVTSPVKGSYQ